MGRPRLDIDYERIDRLHAKGYGSRRIAKEVDASRSTVMRYLGTRDGGSVTKTGSEPGSDTASATYEAGESVSGRAIREDSRRGFARQLLGIRRSSGTESQFNAALEHLEELLVEQPMATSAGVGREALSWYVDRIRDDQRAAEEAQRARESWLRGAKRDLRDRWDTEVPLLVRRLPLRDHATRAELLETARLELERAVEVIERRMSAIEVGASTLGLADALVEEGLERLRAAAEMQT